MSPHTILAIELLKIKADQTNDVRDHDELHAASVVLALINGAVMTKEDLNYIERWLMGLANGNVS